MAEDLLQPVTLRAMAEDLLQPAEKVERTTMEAIEHAACVLCERPSRDPEVRRSADLPPPHPDDAPEWCEAVLTACGGFPHPGDDGIRQAYTRLTAVHELPTWEPRLPRLGTTLRAGELHRCDERQATIGGFTRLPQRTTTYGGCMRALELLLQQGDRRVGLVRPSAPDASPRSSSSSSVAWSCVASGSCGTRGILRCRVHYNPPHLADAERHSDSRAGPIACPSAVIDKPPHGPSCTCHPAQAKCVA